MDYEYEYRVVEEFSAPDYYDEETGEKLYESCDGSLQCYWVVSYDPQEKEIVEWIERFDNPSDARKYINNNLSAKIMEETKNA